MKIENLTTQNYKGAKESYLGVYQITKSVCGIGACPGIYANLGHENNFYLIIGKIEEGSKFGLEKKIGEGEGLVSIPKDLIENFIKEYYGIEVK